MIQASRFPITLAFPPQGHFTQPHLAIPCLVAWLRQHGFQDVQQLDLSVEAFDHFLSRDYLARASERVRERLPLAQLEQQSSAGLDFEHMGAWRRAAESAVSAEVLLERVEDAKEVLRGPRFYDQDQYAPAVRTLYHGLRLVSAAHYPSELTPHNFTMGYANDRSVEVLAATLDEDQNPFIEFFSERVLPQLVQRAPRVLGLSVLYGSQLIPALTLGRLVKRDLPDCHVTMGGGFLAYIGAKVMAAPGMHECLDSIIFHEGEAPLEALCRALQAGKSDLSGVGSLTWFDRSGGAPAAVRNAPMHPLKLDEAPPPDFEGLPFDKYFSPSLVLPYDINRGCYYGECTFCTLPTVIGPGYRTRQAPTIAKHVVELRDRFQTTHFNFITDCMPPGMIRDLPQELIAAEAGVTWWSDARVEPRAYSEEGARHLYQSGCRKLLFGLETATPRILKMMKKGQSLRSVSQVAENCARANISVTFYAMVGFPSETTEEARATLQYIQSQAGRVREVSLQTFHIDEVAQTYREPESFGLEILSDPAADLELYHDYASDVGMTQEEAAEMFEEMMAGLRACLPLFSGDNIYYFMQKSHYFLHLAGGVTPDEFEAACLERTRRIERRDAQPELRPASGLRSVRLAHSYRKVCATLAHPLARAARPDFLTGRFVADAQAEAARRLPAAPREERVLCYDGQSAEFVQLSPDGLRALRAIDRAGSLGELMQSLPPNSGRGLSKLTHFAAELHRLGVLRASQTPQPTLPADLAKNPETRKKRPHART